MNATKIYPTGIIGNKQTSGVTEELRSRIQQNSKQSAEKKYKRQRNSSAKQKKVNPDWIWNPILADQEYYKDGGKVNYSKLRK